LLFGATKGFELVRDRWQGGGFGAVDALYRGAPASTAQVLHPPRHPLGLRPAPPTLPALGGTGCTSVSSAAFGAFELGAPLGALDAAGRVAGPGGAVQVAGHGSTVDLVLAGDRATSDRLAAALGD